MKIDEAFISRVLHGIFLSTLLSFGRLHLMKGSSHFPRGKSPMQPSKKRGVCGGGGTLESRLE